MLGGGLKLALSAAGAILGCGGGETGIRTLGALASTTVFETAPFDHSGTSPQGRSGVKNRRLVNAARRLAEMRAFAKPGKA